MVVRQQTYITPTYTSIASQSELETHPSQSVFAVSQGRIAVSAGSNHDTREPPVTRASRSASTLSTDSLTEDEDPDSLFVPERKLKRDPANTNPGSGYRAASHGVQVSSIIQILHRHKMLINHSRIQLSPGLALSNKQLHSPTWTVCSGTHLTPKMTLTNLKTGLNTTVWAAK